MDASSVSLSVQFVAQLMRHSVAFCVFFAHMSRRELELEVAALKKRKLELSSELNRHSRATAKVAKSRKSMQQTLVCLVSELGAQSLADSTKVATPPQLAGHKLKAELLALFELSGHSSEVVASWLFGHGLGTSGTGQCDPGEMEVAIAGVEWLYIQTPELELATATDSVSEKLLQLGRYVVEHHLFQWLVRQNCDKGVAPKSYQLLAEAVRSVPRAMHAGARAKLTDLFQNPRRVTRKWIARFRKRWDVKDGMLAAGETLEPKVMEDKVTWPLLVVSSAICR